MWLSVRVFCLINLFMMYIVLQTVHIVHITITTSIEWQSALKMRKTQKCLTQKCLSLEFTQMNTIVFHSTLKMSFIWRDFSFILQLIQRPQNSFRSNYDFFSCFFFHQFMSVWVPNFRVQTEKSDAFHICRLEESLTMVQVWPNSHQYNYFNFNNKKISNQVENQWQNW